MATNSPSDGKGADAELRSKNKITITVIVGGTPVQVTANEEAPLRTVIAEALAKSGNLGQNPEEWELANNAGTVFDVDK